MMRSPAGLRLLPLAVTAIAMTLGFTAASVALTSADDLATVRVGVVNSTSEAPFRIAEANGYFKDAGINVEFVPFDNSTKMMAPLAAGQLDVGAGAPAAALYNAVLQKLDVRAVADLAGDPPGYGYEALLVRPDLVSSGRFKTIADLKGLTIAGSSAGATSSSMLNELLKKAGLATSDVKRVYLGWPDHIAGLKNGAIDASIMPEPNATLAVKSGLAAKIVANDQWYPSQEIAVVLYGSTLVKDHRDIGARFMQAYLRGVRYYNGALARGKFAGPNAPLVIKLLAQQTTLKDATLYASLTPNGVDPDGRLRLNSMRTDLAYFKSEGLIDGKIDVDDVVDESFRTDAVKRIGGYVAAKGARK